LPVEERDCGIDICGGGSATIYIVYMGKAIYGKA
jgi:hypothetical protein